MGDEAFEALCSSYFDRVYGYLLLMLKDAAEAERAVQQVFIGAYAAGWQGSTVPLFRIAHREALDGPCGAAANVHESSPMCSGGGRHADFRVPEWKSDRELAALIEGLAPPEREVIVLTYMLGLSVAEVTEIVGRDQVAVRGLGARGLSLLGAEACSSGESRPAELVA